MASKHKCSDAGNSHMPKESCGMILLREKVEVLDSIRKEGRKKQAEVAKIYSKNKYYIVELWRKKEFIFVLLFNLNLQNSQPQCVSVQLR